MIQFQSLKGQDPSTLEHADIQQLQADIPVPATSPPSMSHGDTRTAPKGDPGGDPLVCDKTAKRRKAGVNVILENQRSESLVPH